jgi:hypothetical protein
LSFYNLPDVLALDTWPFFIVMAAKPQANTHWLQEVQRDSSI